ncbi:hypothetical protein ABZ949_01950 [Micromonospora tulbaghiae]|uniref:DUF7736 domain-containing protein n=1 Tax=Micromonospora tulbaghiae TaxID=479978 RepID=UPI00340C236A
MTDTRSKPFHLGDILSITTGRLVSPDHIDGVYRILNHMTGDSLFTHQLGRASDECTPELLRQHPDLAEVVPPKFDGEAHIWRWLAEQTDRYGITREVTPLAPADHTRIDPIAEMKMMKPDIEVITVEVDGGPEASR